MKLHQKNIYLQKTANNREETAMEIDFKKMGLVLEGGG